ncbi:MAG: hypothetical protein M3Q65_15825 [Chloroflexota bacterium]|nr:hypothetical protein [Chloroflexota bacterium]
MRSITPYQELKARLTASLPGFTNYDEAEFVAWVGELVAIKRKQYENDWRYDVESKVRSMLDEAEKIRGRLARGEAQLRPMPADGWIPPWAQTLESIFIQRFFQARPGPADGGERGSPYSSSDSYSSSPPPPRPEPRVYVVPATPTNEPEATPAQATGEKDLGPTPQPRHQPHQRWRSPVHREEAERIVKLLAQNKRWSDIERSTGIPERTCRYRLMQFPELDPRRK